MENKESSERNSEKISHLNEIFQDLVSDASELIKDLYSCVKTFLFYGLIMILFGVEEIVSNIDLLQERLYIPLFVAGCLLFAGTAQIIRYFRLRRKYSKLFKIQGDLKKPWEN